MKKIDIDAIDTGNFEGKHLRGELLAALKERTGVKIRIPINSSTHSDILTKSGRIPTGFSGRLNRNRWTNKNGIGGRITPDYAKNSGMGK